MSNKSSTCLEPNNSHHHNMLFSYNTSNPNHNSNVFGCHLCNGRLLFLSFTTFYICRKSSRTNMRCCLKLFRMLLPWPGIVLLISIRRLRLLLLTFFYSFWFFYLFLIILIVLLYFLNLKAVKLNTKIKAFLTFYLFKKKLKKFYLRLKNQNYFQNIKNSSNNNSYRIISDFWVFLIDDIDEFFVANDSVSVFISIINHLINFSSWKVLSNAGCDLFEFLWTESSLFVNIEGFEELSNWSFTVSISTESEDFKESSEIHFLGCGSSWDDTDDLLSLVFNAEGSDCVDQFFTRDVSTSVVIEDIETFLKLEDGVFIEVFANVLLGVELKE